MLERAGYISCRRGSASIRFRATTPLAAKITTNVTQLTTIQPTIAHIRLYLFPFLNLPLLKSASFGFPLPLQFRNDKFIETAGLERNRALNPRLSGARSPFDFQRGFQIWKEYSAS
ncbi:hypothetical protein E2542_SST03187 [Spatholobus suberectus]|nr:hypothetical protein E2542_SST03187 [Spatholobus suberectus]